jgi:hypothetical protein
MALEATDLLVVQKQSGGKEVRKASLQQLNDYLQTEPGVVYKGQANFTDAGEEPSSKNTGDLYINDAPGAGTWAWSANSNSITDVTPGDRALWNGAAWDIIQSGADDIGVSAVTGSLPITISGTAGEPNVEIEQATTTAAGAVARLATTADVNPIDGTGETTAVVTADLLKQTNIDLAAATSGGLTSVQGVDPIEVATTGGGATVNSPEISIKDAGFTQKGAVALQETGSAPATATDKAATPGYVDAYYVIKDFSSLAEA